MVNALARQTSDLFHATRSDVDDSRDGRVHEYMNDEGDGNAC
jgi:hypothetical protein